MARLHNFTHRLTVMGKCTEVRPDEGSFSLTCRSGDTFRIFVGETTDFRVMQNLDGLDRDRVLDPAEGLDGSQPRALGLIKKYVWPDGLLTVQGVYQEHGDESRFDANSVHLMHSEQGRYLFEDTHWWLTQIARLADEWLDDLFKDRRTYQRDDFAALYRTNLNILGLPTDQDPDLQECATLSRLIYGLSSAYLLTGSERYFLAAKAGVEYQRETFRNLSHDGKYCFWAYGKRKGAYGSRLIVPSENEDDRDTIPLYEQIYALAGITQYYRITADWEVLEDIRRTIYAFNAFYLDETSPARPWAKGYGGYFSHIDYATLRPDSEVLGDNQRKKNWNSIGDHIPAYLVNLMLSLDPIPKGRDDVQEIIEFTEKCRKILETTAALIVKHFPDPSDKTPYVRERFLEDWHPDPNWRWQQDRAIIGHNLKISWNLTRVANYYSSQREKALAEKDETRAAEYEDRAASMIALAESLASTMAKVGVDQIRSGVFDAVERNPATGMPLEFAWQNTKDFWQQEQAILAYLILFGYTGKEEYLELARELSAFWNLFFLDYANRGIYFRVTDDGLPYILGNYINKGGHSISGYHVFELNYLAHLYGRMYLQKQETDNNFCLHFRPATNSRQRSINVLPDFVKPGDVTIKRIRVDGVSRSTIDADNFQVELDPSELGCEVVVEFAPRSST